MRKCFFVKRVASFCDTRTKPYTLIYVTHLPSQSTQSVYALMNGAVIETHVSNTQYMMLLNNKTQLEQTQIIVDIGAIWRTFIQEPTVAKRRKQIALSMVRNVQISYSAPCWSEQHDAVKGSVCSVRHIMKWLATDCYTPNWKVGIPFFTTAVISPQ